MAFFFKTQTDIETIKRKLADKDREIATAEQRRRETALEAVLSNNPADAATLLAEAAALAAERALLVDALVAAEAREVERAEQARSEEEKRQAEALRRAREASINAGRKHLERWLKGVRAAEAAIENLAAAFHEICDAADRFDATLPAKADFRVWSGRAYADRNKAPFKRSLLIEQELARAGAKHSVRLPGAADGVPERSAVETAAETVEELKAHARQELLGEGPKLPKPEPDTVIEVEEPPPPPRQRFEPEIDRLAASQMGRAKVSRIVMPGASLPTDPVVEQQAAARFWQGRGEEVDASGSPLPKHNPSIEE